MTRFLFVWIFGTLPFALVVLATAKGDWVWGAAAALAVSLVMTMADAIQRDRGIK
jgi:hypothetical protein